MSNEAKLFNHLAQHNVARLQIDFKGDYEQYDDDDWGFHVNTKAEAVNAKGETVDLDDIDEIDILWNDDWQERLGVGDWSRDGEDDWGQGAKGTIIFDVATRTVHLTATAKVKVHRWETEVINTSWKVEDKETAAA